MFLHSRYGKLTLYKPISWILFQRISNYPIKMPRSLLNFNKSIASAIKMTRLSMPVEYSGKADLMFVLELPQKLFLSAADGEVVQVNV